MCLSINTLLCAVIFISSVDFSVFGYKKRQYEQSLFLLCGMLIT